MNSEFNEKFNISYFDENLSVPTKKLAIKHCLCSYLVYFTIYVILINNPFFNQYFIDEIRHCYEMAFLLYLVIAPVIYIGFRPKTLYNSHNIEICGYFVKLFKSIFNKDTILKQNYKNVLAGFTPSYHQKQALMFIFIKVFFGTLMVKFFYDYIQNLMTYNSIIRQAFDGIFVNFSFEDFKQAIIANSNLLYIYAVNFLFTVDVACFSVGYLTECTFLKNKIRTVETSLAGILVCIICYPPFNNVTTTFLGWNQNNYAIAFNEHSVLGWCLRIIALLFLTVYALASLALGTRASNLTNRGTVSVFPYNIVRHPAYISKTMFWFFTTIPLLIVNLDYIQNNFARYINHFLLITCSFLFWALIYYFRAITEERHLMLDPEYQEYAKKVKWRFIPFIF